LGTVQRWRSARPARAAPSLAQLTTTGWRRPPPPSPGAAGGGGGDKAPDTGRKVAPPRRTPFSKDKSRNLAVTGRGSADAVPRGGQHASGSARRRSPDVSLHAALPRLHSDRVVSRYRDHRYPRRDPFPSLRPGAREGALSDLPEQLEADRDS